MIPRMDFGSGAQVGVSKKIAWRAPIRRVADLSKPLGPGEYWHGTSRESAKHIKEHGFSYQDPRNKTLRGIDQRIYTDPAFKDSEGFSTNAWGKVRTNRGRPLARGDFGPGIYGTNKASEGAAYGRVVGAGAKRRIGMALHPLTPGAHGEVLRMKVHGPVATHLDMLPGAQGKGRTMSAKAAKQGYVGAEAHPGGAIGQLTDPKHRHVVVGNPKNVSMVHGPQTWAAGWTPGEYTVAGAVGVGGTIGTKDYLERRQMKRAKAGPVKKFAGTAVLAGGSLGGASGLLSRPDLSEHRRRKRAAAGTALGAATPLVASYGYMGAKKHRELQDLINSVQDVPEKDWAAHAKHLKPEMKRLARPGLIGGLATVGAGSAAYAAAHRKKWKSNPSLVNKRRKDRDQFARNAYAIAAAPAAVGVAGSLGTGAVARRHMNRYYKETMPLVAQHADAMTRHRSKLGESGLTPTERAVHEALAENEGKWRAMHLPKAEANLAQRAKWGARSMKSLKYGGLASVPLLAGAGGVHLGRRQQRGSS